MDGASAMAPLLAHHPALHFAGAVLLHRRPPRSARCRCSSRSCILTNGGPGDAHALAVDLSSSRRPSARFELGYGAASRRCIMMLVDPRSLTLIAVRLASAMRGVRLGISTQSRAAKRAVDMRHHRRAACCWRMLMLMPLPVAVLDVVPAGRRMPTRCRRASSRRRWISPTTGRCCNSRVPFLQIYWNIVYVAVLVTIGQLVTCTLAAFAFARLRFPGATALFFIMLIGLMFPAQVTILPIYLGYAKIGLHQQSDRSAC